MAHAGKEWTGLALARAFVCLPTQLLIQYPSDSKHCVYQSALECIYMAPLLFLQGQTGAGASDLATEFC